jgi:hypothetical protein
VSVVVILLMFSAVVLMVRNVETVREQPLPLASDSSKKEVRIALDKSL